MEIDFICFLSSLLSERCRTPLLLSRPPSTTTPTVHHHHHLSSPRQRCILVEEKKNTPHTSFLLGLVCFSKWQYVNNRSTVCPITNLKTSFCAGHFKKCKCSSSSLVSSSFLSFLHRLPRVCCWLTVHSCRESTSGAA